MTRSVSAAAEHSDSEAVDVARPAITTQPSGDRGYSFVELLVTMSLLALVMTAIFPLFVLATKQNSADAARNVALNIAQDRIEKVRQLDFDDIDLQYLESSTFYGGQFGKTFDVTRAGSTKTYDIAYTVHAVKASPTSTAVLYKEVTVVVTWRGNPRPVKPVELKTVVYRQWAGPQTTSISLNPPPSSPPSGLVPDDVAAFFQNERWITSTDADETVNVYINKNDVRLMSGVDSKTGQALAGRVEIVIASTTGLVVSESVSVPSGESDTLYSYLWELEPGGVAVADGFYTISATAFSYDGAQGNTLSTRVRVEVNQPTPATSVQAGGGQALDTSGQVIITWNPSLAPDFMFYEVKRFVGSAEGVVIAGKRSDQATWLKTTAYFDTGLVYGSSVRYEVRAVDQAFRYSGPASASCIWSLTGPTPPPPVSLAAAQPVGNTVTLTWQQPDDTRNVSAYQVFRDGNAAVIATVTGLSCQFAQEYSSMHSYQVRAVNRVGLGLSDLATLADSQTFVELGSPPWPWVQVQVGQERLFDVEVVNKTGGKCDWITFYYLGPDGQSPRSPVRTWYNVNNNATTLAEPGQHAGYYEVEWKLKTSSLPPAPQSFSIPPTTVQNPVQFMITN